MPASGYRNNDDGALNNVGNNGNYWSVTPNRYSAYNLYFYDNGSVSPTNFDYRARGFSVRCLQESE